MNIYGRYSSKKNMTTSAYINKIYIFVFVTLLFTLPLRATESPNPNLKADFIMTRKVAVLKESLTSKGRLMLGGKGRLRWETTSPNKSTLIVNGANGWLHYPDLSVTKAFDMASDPVMRLMSEQLCALTGGDLTALSSLYEIRAGRDGEKLLVPKDPNIRKLFRTLHVIMPKTGVVSEVTLVSANGDTTTIEFSNTVQNATLDPRLFMAPSKGATH